MILLTEEEIKTVVGDFILEPSFSNLLNYLKDSNKAQLKKVLEWLGECSWDGSLQHWGAPLPDGSYHNVQCVDMRDWQALLKEIE